MAKLFVDSTTPLNAANLNKLMAGDSDTAYQLAVWGLRIRYTGSAWEASSGYGADGQATNVDLTWNATDDKLIIDFSNPGIDNAFTTRTIPIATAAASGVAGDTNYFYDVKVQSWSSTIVHVQFYDSETDIRLPVGTESANMSFYITFLGKIG